MYLIKDAQAKFDTKQEDILALIYRRPCTVDDMAMGLKIQPSEVIKLMGSLILEGRVKKDYHDGKVFFHKFPKL